MNPRRFLPQAALALILLIFSLTLCAGSTGRIKGKVVDENSGDPIYCASIRIEGTAMEAKTNWDGDFLLLGVPPGTYSLIVSSVGHESITLTDIKVDSNQTVEVNIPMKQGVLNSGKVTEVKGVRKEIVFLETGTRTIKTQQEIPVAPVAAVNDLITRESGHGCPPAHGGTSIVNDQAFDAMFFKNYGVNPFVDTEDDHLSTFAVDVDDASFIMTRSYLERGSLPPDDAVRVEEFINHFDYGYKAPHSETFKVYFDGSPSLFGNNCSLLRIGIKGMEISPENRKDANLVFVIDVSGSMGRENRLGLVKKALRMLVDELTGSDRAGIVVYGSRGRALLEPTSIRDRHRILEAIEWLQPEGATNAEEGLRLGYEMADRVFEKGKINRIILCSDGVANVGRSGPDAILKQIKKYADKGITLSSIGFGMGNYNDLLLEKLGNKGNGHYAYVDDLAEAKRVFVDNLTGNLQVIARDVKIQVDFNPEVVSSYRLLGYENRDVADDRFRDDREDGGEIGAGHAVTALYEIKFHKKSSGGPVGTVYIRYKDPDNFEVTEISRTIDKQVFAAEFEDCTPSFRLAAAAAEFAEILRQSYWARGSSLAGVLKVVKDIHREMESNDIIELMHLISRAESLQVDRAEH